MPYQINTVQNDRVRLWCFRPLYQEASFGILVGLRHNYYFHCIFGVFFRWKYLWSSEELSEVSEEAVKLASHPTTKMFQTVYVAHLEMTGDLKAQHLVGSVEKCKVKIAKSETKFFIPSFESNLCNELLLTLHLSFLPGATSSFTWKWSERMN